MLFFKIESDYNINNKFAYRTKFDKGMSFLLAKNIILNICSKNFGGIFDYTRL
jgi:hypothetical protein